MNNLVTAVEEWSKEKQLHTADPRSQAMKIVEELGETCSAYLKQDMEALEDGLGDVLVTIIIFCQQVGIAPEQALQTAYNVISKRKGALNEHGTFVKDAE